MVNEDLVQNWISNVIICRSLFLNCIARKLMLAHVFIKIIEFVCMSNRYFYDKECPSKEILCWETHLTVEQNSLLLLVRLKLWRRAKSNVIL